MSTFLSHIEEVLWVDGWVSIGVWGLKGIPLFPTIAKSFQTWGRAVSLLGRLPNCIQCSLRQRRRQGAETYSSALRRGRKIREKLAFALVTAARKLKPYFQAHIVVILTDKPLRRAISNPETAWRMALWAIEWSEFDVQYQPCTAIKG